MHNGDPYPMGLWKYLNCLPDTSSDCQAVTVIRLKPHLGYIAFVCHPDVKQTNCLQSLKGQEYIYVCPHLRPFSSLREHFSLAVPASLQ